MTEKREIMVNEIVDEIIAFFPGERAVTPFQSGSIGVRMRPLRGAEGAIGLMHDVKGEVW